MVIYSQRASIRSQNEIGQLGNAFDTMTFRIQELLNTLEKRVETRTKDLEAARLEAENANHVKSQFLSSMSHELRTPLNAIINFSSFVADGDVGPVSDEQSEILGDVVKSAKHLLSLINDVLDMSKIESGSLQLYISENININQLINDLEPIAKVLLKDKDVDVILELEEQLPNISADRQRITQVLLNLISNACKFIEKGTFSIHSMQKDESIIVSVQDTGMGIAQEDFEAIFESFKQTDQGVRQGGGTGLGLPISRSLVEAHGGKMWLTSKMGVGTTFFFSLPINSDSKDTFLEKSA